MIENFNLLRKISEDKLGVVYVAEQLAPPKKVLVKVYSLQSETKTFATNLADVAYNFPNIQLFKTEKVIYAVVDNKEYISDLHQLELAAIKKWEESQEDLLSEIDEIARFTKNKLKPQTTTNWEPVIKKIVISAAVIGIGFASFQVLISNYFYSVSELKVPDIRKYKLGEAESKLKSLGLKPIVVASLPSLDIPKDCIVEVFPEPGSTVKKGRRIRLKVSSGKNQLVAPDLVGRNVDQVHNLLQRMNLKLAIVEDSAPYNSSVPAGRIVSQNIAPNSQVNEGETLTVFVTKGIPFNISAVSDNDDPGVAILKFGCSIPAEAKATSVKVLALSPGHKQVVIDEQINAGEKIFKQYKVKADSSIEVYYDNQLAYKKTLSNLLSQWKKY